MTKKKNFIIITVFFFLIVFLIIAYTLVTDNLLKEKASDFLINEYNMIVDVGKNGLLEISEEITVDSKSSKKSFIRPIAKKGVYTNQEGTTIHKKGTVSNLKITGSNKYHVIEDSNNVLVEFYDEDLSKQNIYSIKYTYDMGSNKYDYYDELFLRFFDDYSNSKVKKAEITVNMPSILDDVNVNIYKDYYRHFKADVNYKIVNNSIIVKYTNSKAILSNGLTLDIVLPDNYFEDSSSFSWISLILVLIVIEISITFILKALRKAGDVDKLMYEKIEVSAVNYLANNKEVTKATFVNVLFQLVHKKCIKIEEEKINGVKRLKVINLLCKPNMPDKPIKKNINRSIAIKRIRFDEIGLTKEEDAFIKKVFKNEYIVSIKNNLDEFMKLKDGLLEKKYIDIINDNANEIDDERNLLEKEYQNSLSEYNKLNDIYEKELLSYNTNVKLAKEKSLIEKCVFRILLGEKKSLILFEYQELDAVIQKMKEIFENMLNSNIRVYRDKTPKYKVLVAIYISIILWMLAYYIVSDMNYKYYFLYYVSLASIILNTMITSFSSSKMSYQKFLESQITIFKKDYINNKSVEVNKDSYYDLLSMAYSLGVADEFINKYHEVSPNDKFDINYFLNGKVEKNIRSYADDD